MVKKEFLKEKAGRIDFFGENLISAPKTDFLILEESYSGFLFFFSAFFISTFSCFSLSLANSCSCKVSLFNCALLSFLTNFTSTSWIFSSSISFLVLTAFTLHFSSFSWICFFRFSSTLDILFSIAATSAAITGFSSSSTFCFDKVLAFSTSARALTTFSSIRDFRLVSAFWSRSVRGALWVVVVNFLAITSLPIFASESWSSKAAPYSFSLIVLGDTDILKFLRVS